MGVPRWLRTAAGKPASAWTWTKVQVTAKRATGAGVAVLFVVGALLWATGKDETKQSDLGSSILGGLIVGIAVVVAERHFTRAVQAKSEALEKAVQIQGDDLRGLAAMPGAAPLRDDQAPPAEEPPAEEPPAEEAPAEEPPAEEAPAEEAPAEEVVIPPGRYTVQYDSRMRSPNRVDAIQARMRMYRGDDYVQFITAVAPGPSYRLVAENVPPEEFWWSFAKLAGQLAERALRQGIIPLDDPSIAYEVQPSVDDAIRLARRERRAVEEGAIVHEFDAGGFADDLRGAQNGGLSVRVGFRNGDQSGLWGVADVDEAGGTVTFEVPVTFGTTNRRRVALDDIAWVEVTDIAF